MPRIKSASEVLLNKRLFFIIVLSIAFIISNDLWSNETINAPVTGLDDLTHYPRLENYEEGSVQVDFPTVDDWQDFQRMKVWLPVEVRLKSENDPYVG